MFSHIRFVVEPNVAAVLQEYCIIPAERKEKKMNGQDLKSLEQKANEIGENIVEGTKDVYQKVENGAVSGYETVENAVTEGYKNVEETVTGGYKTVEDKVVSAYKAVENGVVSGFNKIADGFVDAFLKKDGETTKEARARLEAEQKAREEKYKK